MSWKRRIKPRIDQQKLGTRRFTKMNTVLSCTPSTQFHLGTDVRYHCVPKCTVFHCLFQDCGPLEKASKLKIATTT